MIYNRTLIVRQAVGFQRIGGAVSSDTINLTIKRVTPGADYQWLVKENIDDPDNQALAGDFGTISSNDLIVSINLNSDFTIGDTYYFALREFKTPSDSQEVIQVSFTIAQNAVLGQGTNPLNILPLYLPNFTTEARDELVSTNAMLIYNTDTEQVEQYNPDSDTWSGFDLSGKYDKIGGPISGNVTIEKGTATEKSDLVLESYPDGGGNNFDSTGRIITKSYQRAQYTSPNDSYAHYGETIRMEVNESQAKNAMAWINEAYPLMKKCMAWIIAHFASNDDPNLFHNHISVELPDENGFMQTALEWPFGYFGNQPSLGIPVADHYTRSTRKLIMANMGGYIENPEGAEKNLFYGHSIANEHKGQLGLRRWNAQMDASGNYRINRHSTTDGSFVATVLFVGLDGRFGVNTTTPAFTIDMLGSTRISGATGIYNAPLIVEAPSGDVLQHFNRGSGTLVDANRRFSLGLLGSALEEDRRFGIIRRGVTGTFLNIPFVIDALGRIGLNTPNPTSTVHITGETTIAGQVKGLLEPTDAQDAVTKNYVDTKENDWQQSDYGYISWAYDIANITNTYVVPSGRLVVARLRCRRPTTINSASFVITNTPAGLANCYMAIYQNDVLLAQSTDQSASWSTAGLKTATFPTPISVPAGPIDVVLWAGTQSTQIQIGRGSGFSGSTQGLPAGQERFGLADSGITTTAPATLGARTPTLTVTPWAAIS